MAGIFDIFSTGPADQAAAAQQQGLNQGYGQLSQLLGMGNQTLASNYGQALAPYQQNYGVASQGQQQLANALGLGGAAGNAQALAAFQNNPGYQFQVQQATQGVDRNQAAAGMLGSGNTNVDLSNYISGLANQGWNQYLGLLQPFLGAANSAAQGIGGLFSGLGQGINQNINTQGQAAYGTQAGIGQAQAGADLSAYNASANALNGILGLGKMAISAGTGMPMMGGGNTFSAPGQSTGGGGAGGGAGGGNMYGSYANSPFGQFGTWLSNQFNPPGTGWLPPG